MYIANTKTFCLIRTEWKINLNGFTPLSISHKKKKIINIGLKINIPWSIKLSISESVQGHLFRSSCKDTFDVRPPAPHL